MQELLNRENTLEVRIPLSNPLCVKLCSRTGYVNLTHLAKNIGCEIKKWHRLKTTQTSLEKISIDNGVKTVDMLLFQKKGYGNDDRDTYGLVSIALEMMNQFLDEKDIDIIRKTLEPYDQLNKCVISEMKDRTSQQHGWTTKMLPTDTMSTYMNKTVFYIGRALTHDNLIVGKFGGSGDIVKRIGSHRNDFKYFTIDAVFIVDNHTAAQALFKLDMTSRGALMTTPVNFRNYIELFDLSRVSIDHAIQCAKQLFTPKVTQSVQTEQADFAMDDIVNILANTFVKKVPVPYVDASCQTDITGPEYLTNQVEKIKELQMIVNLLSVSQGGTTASTPLMTTGMNRKENGLTEDDKEFAKIEIKTPVSIKEAYDFWCCQLKPMVEYYGGHVPWKLLFKGKSVAYKLAYSRMKPFFMYVDTSQSIHNIPSALVVTKLSNIARKHAITPSMFIKQCMYNLIHENTDSQKQTLSTTQLIVEMERENLPIPPRAS